MATNRGPLLGPWCEEGSGSVSFFARSGCGVSYSSKIASEMIDCSLDKTARSTAFLIEYRENFSSLFGPAGERFPIKVSVWKRPFNEGQGVVIQRLTSPNCPCTYRYLICPDSGTKLWEASGKPQHYLLSFRELVLCGCYGRVAPSGWYVPYPPPNEVMAAQRSIGQEGPYIYISQYEPREPVWLPLAKAPDIDDFPKITTVEFRRMSLQLGMTGFGKDEWSVTDQGVFFDVFPRMETEGKFSKIATRR